MSRWSRFVPSLLALALLVVMIGCDSASDENSPPRINRAWAQPDTVLPNGSVTLFVDAEDPDAGTPDAEFDSLSIQWSSAEGNFPAADDQFQVQWTAPNAQGRFGIQVQVSDGKETVTDSVFVVVSEIVTNAQYAITILDPRSSQFFTINDSIEFVARVIGVQDFNDVDVNVEAFSDAQGLLFEAVPDTEGFVFAYRGLQAGIHHINMVAEIDHQYNAIDTVTVSVLDIQPNELYPIERRYEANRLEWHHEADESLFQYYSIVRSVNGSAYQELVQIESPTATTYLDTNVVLGALYTYRVDATYDLDVVVPSAQHTIRAGVFTEYGSPITDMFYDEQREYLFIALPELDLAYEIDVTANNIDYYYAFNDTIPGEEYPILFDPVSFTLNEGDRTLYVASQGDSAIWRIPLDAGLFTRLIDLRPYGMKPLYLDYDPNGDVLYGTGNNRFPLYVPNPDSWVPGNGVNFISDSRLVVNNSFLLIDETRDLLYISEVGSYPASLWKYDISGNNPSLLLEDDHGSLGYLLWDLDFTRGNNRLLLAGDYPHYVQIVHTSDFRLVDQFDTGPYPRAVTVSEDGSHIYIGTASANEIQVWDFDSGEKIEVIEFDDPISRNGIRLSSDESILMVSTDSSPGDTRLFIIYR
ncbi:hypothetical protein KQI63_08165 [bacterium]|nr:hypothetical protein [bacterium]